MTATLPARALPVDVEAGWDGSRWVGVWEVGQCCHCLKLLDPARVGRKHTAFCDEFCRLHAGQIRYVREAIRDGRVEDLFTAMVIRGNHITFLAYDLAYVRVRLPEKLRQEVLAANDGLCVACNAQPATEVDHIRGGSQERDNLQGLCRRCHEAKPRGPIPDDLTRDGAGAVDESEVTEWLLQMWRDLLLEPCTYDDEDPEQVWFDLLTAARSEPDNRFARITLEILDPEPHAPAHAPQWTTSWREYGRRTRTWATAAT